MSPSDTNTQPIPLNTMTADQQQQPAQPQPAHLDSQPAKHQPMDPQQPHAESELTLRGGDRGGMCPGRFCFIIPCPIPCNCCIIPL